MLRSEGATGIGGVCEDPAWTISSDHYALRIHVKCSVPVGKRKQQRFNMVGWQPRDDVQLKRFQSLLASKLGVDCAGRTTSEASLQSFELEISRAASSIDILHVLRFPLTCPGLQQRRN